jgi:hypothetical protein
MAFLKNMATTTPRRSRSPVLPATMQATSILGSDLFLGKWHSVEMENWSSDYLDLVEQTHISFGPIEEGDHAQS